MLFVIFLLKDNLPWIIFNSAKIIIIIMCIKTQTCFWIQFLFWISIYLQFLLIPLFFFFFQPVGPYILLLSFWAFPLQTIFFKIIFTFNKKKKHKKLYFDQWNNFLGVSFFPTVEFLIYCWYSLSYVFAALFSLCDRFILISGTKFLTSKNESPDFFYIWFVSCILFFQALICSGNTLKSSNNLPLV